MPHALAARSAPEWAASMISSISAPRRWCRWGAKRISPCTMPSAWKVLDQLVRCSLEAVAALQDVHFDIDRGQELDQAATAAWNRCQPFDGLVEPETGSFSQVSNGRDAHRAVEVAVELDSRDRRGFPHAGSSRQASISSCWNRFSSARVTIVALASGATPRRSTKVPPRPASSRPISRCTGSCAVATSGARATAIASGSGRS